MSGRARISAENSARKILRRHLVVEASAALPVDRGIHCTAGETMNGNIAYLAAGFGVGIGLLGVGVGIGRLGAATMEGMARQPSAGGEIRSAMLLAASFIEGVAL